MSDPDDFFHEPAVKEGYGHDFYPVRWHPYKPKHTAQTGRKGRWQRMNSYGGWDNCERPAAIFPTHDILTELLEALKRLEATVRILPPDMDEPGSPLAQARAAIAKAEGQS